MRQIILDTETTGLRVEDGHKIIEIGCVELVNRKPSGRHYHQYINPRRDIEEGALRVHGITTDFLKDKPVFADVAQEFMDFVQGAELIIHNAPFDTGFINGELKVLGNVWKMIHDYCTVLDTLALARQLHPGQRNSLDALCKRYSIDNTHRELHGALLDAHLLARVYLAMTGGQGSLFGDMTNTQGEETVASATDTQVRQVQTRKTVSMPILLATPEELAEHKNRLEALKKQGKCVWDLMDG